MNSQVTDISGIPLVDVPVILSVVGEEEFICDLVSDEEGRFNSSLLLPLGYGGTYSLTAYASLEGAEKASKSKTFYVEGPYLALPEEIKITQGYTVKQEVTLSNVGTIELSGFEFSSQFPEGAGMDAQFTGSILELLGPSQQETFTLELSCPGYYTWVSMRHYLPLELKRVLYHCISKSVSGRGPRSIELILMEKTERILPQP